jgi:hypothetical protein
MIEPFEGEVSINNQKSAIINALKSSTADGGDVEERRFSAAYPRKEQRASAPVCFNQQ